MSDHGAGAQRKTCSILIKWIDGRDSLKKYLQNEFSRKIKSKQENHTVIIGWMLMMMMMMMDGWWWIDDGDAASHWWWWASMEFAAAKKTRIKKGSDSFSWEDFHFSYFSTFFYPLLYFTCSHLSIFFFFFFLFYFFLFLIFFFNFSFFLLSTIFSYFCIFSLLIWCLDPLEL